jgi:hypothetical protein
MLASHPTVRFQFAKASVLCQAADAGAIDVHAAAARRGGLAADRVGRVHRRC